MLYRMATPPMWSKNTTMLGESVLLWTMLQLTLQAAWHHLMHGMRSWNSSQHLRAPCLIDYFMPTASQTLCGAPRVDISTSGCGCVQWQPHTVVAKLQEGISASPILLSPGKLSNCPAGQSTNAATPAQDATHGQLPAGQSTSCHISDHPTQPECSLCSCIT